MISIRTAEELSAMRESGRVNALVHRAIRSQLAPGITTRDLDDIAGTILAQHGAISSFAHTMDFPGHICISVNEEAGHGVPGGRVIQDGDLVKVDVGVEVDGLHTDSAWTYPVGEIDATTRRLLVVTQQALRRGITKVLPQQRMSDVSGEIATFIAKTGFSAIRTAFGHGIGWQVHEEPRIPSFGPAGLGPRWKSGMTVAIEPVLTTGFPFTRTLEDGWTTVTVDGSASAHFEHTVLVTDGPPEILTTLQDEPNVAANPPVLRVSLEPAPFGCRPKTAEDEPWMLDVARREMGSILMEAWGRTVAAHDLDGPPGSHVLIMEDAGGQPVGFFSFMSTGEALHLNTLIIHGSFQGQGYGEAAMRTVEAQAMSDGHVAVDLWVQVNNRRAIQFYEKLGFERMGTPYVNSLEMRKVLPLPTNI